MITLRPNQEEPVRKAIEFFKQKNPKPSLIVLPTAWGKSILTAFVAANSEDKMIVLQPSKELLEQNYTKYLNLCGFMANAGIYSASFNRKEVNHITYATIGSIKNLGEEFKRMGFTKMLIDEAHLFPREANSMLGRFLKDSGITHRQDVLNLEAGLAIPTMLMPFGKYKGEKVADIPLGYRNWMLQNFQWDARNQHLRTAILATIGK